MRKFRANMLMAVHQALAETYIKGNSKYLTSVELAEKSGVGESTIKSMFEEKAMTKFADENVMDVKLGNGRHKYYPTFQISKQGLVNYHD